MLERKLHTTAAGAAMSSTTRLAMTPLPAPPSPACRRGVAYPPRYRVVTYPLSGIWTSTRARNSSGSAEYGADLIAHGMLARMSGKGNCFDSAVAESVFATLEFELIARHAIFHYIETW